MAEQRGRSGRGRGRGRGRGSAAPNRDEQQVPGGGAPHDHENPGRLEGAAQAATGSGAPELGRAAGGAQEWAAPPAHAAQTHPQQYSNYNPNQPPQMPQYEGHYYYSGEQSTPYQQQQQQQPYWIPGPSGDAQAGPSAPHSSYARGGPFPVQQAAAPAGRGRGGRRGEKGPGGRHHEATPYQQQQNQQHYRSHQHQNGQYNQMQQHQHQSQQQQNYQYQQIQQQNQQYTHQAQYTGTHQQLRSQPQQQWVPRGTAPGSAPGLDSAQGPTGTQGLLPAPYPPAPASTNGNSLERGPAGGRGRGSRARGGGARGAGVAGRGGRGSGEPAPRRGGHQGRGQQGGRPKQSPYGAGGDALSALGSTASSESGSQGGGGRAAQSWLSGESVPELVQEIERRLRQEELECMICYETVRRKHAVWSCGGCYSIFHLHCAQAWASAPTSSAAAGAAPGQPPASGPGPVLQSEGMATSLVLNGSAAGSASGAGVENWRCPGCQAVQWGGASKLRYFCFCGQLPDPPADPFLIPHSCGETCRRPLGGRSAEPIDSATSSAAAATAVSGHGAEGGGGEGEGKGGGASGGSGGSGPYVCPHHCVLQCHPGPCPPCSAMSAPLPCFCGRECRSRRCADLSKEGSAGFGCGAPCGKLLENCGRHRCAEPCHPGPCAPCSVLVDAKCFCGASEEALSCGEHKRMVQAEEQRLGRSDSNNNQGTERTEPSTEEEEGKGVSTGGGLFCCGKKCGRELPCGKHTCERLCHAGDCGPCHLSPSVITTCPCAKHSLEDLLKRRTPGTSGAAGAGKAPQSLRTSCTDPVPTCGEPCGKLQACGEHRCKSRCHAGPCPRCEEPAEQRCVCGDSVRTAPCWQARLSSAAAAEEGNAGESSGTTGAGPEGGALDELLSGGPYRCDKKCNAKKNCGRHRCTNRCCPAASVGAGSGAQGGASLDAIAAAEEVHRCLFVCGKSLQCRQHSCQELCHSGHCPPCMAALFNELSCACGRTIIPPPNPCGTPLPACEAPCQKPQPCGHPAAHLCHFGPCPPCTVPAAKACVGGHVVLRGVPCGSKEIKCSQMCARMRQCQQHVCQRTCHSGPCDAPPDSQQAPTDGPHPAQAAPVPGIGLVLSCGQPCGTQRKDCQHQCQAACHPGDVCPSLRCTVPVTIACACGRLSAQVPCGAGAPPESKPSAWRGAPAVAPGQEGLPPGKCKLACDEECEKLARRRALAEAFSSTPGAAKADVGLFEAGDAVALSKGGGLPPSVASLLRSDPQWVAAVEARLQFLVLGPTRGSSGGTASDTVIGGRGGWTRDAVRFHVFRPMPRERREALHFLAERWHLGVESKGREPRRFPLAFATRKSRAPDWRLPLKPALDSAPSPGQAASAPAASADIDFDPACVVPLVHLPSDSQLGKQLLRFGGECELLWLSDSNAVAVFEEKGRAATARRYLDHTCSYVGAIAMPVSGTLGVGTGSAFSSTVKGWGQAPAPSSSSSWAAAAGAPTGSRGRAAQAGMGDAWADEVPSRNGHLSTLGSAVVGSGAGAVVYGRTGASIEVAANPFDALVKAEPGGGGAWEQVKSSKAAPGGKGEVMKGERAAAPEGPRRATLPPQGEGMEDWEDMLDE